VHPSPSGLTDEHRLEELFRSHADAVLTFLRHRTDPETAQDVLTETFLIAWRKLGEVPQDPRGWLYGVARRVLANNVRSAGRTAAIVDRLLTETRFVPGDTGIDDAIHRHDVLMALAELPEADREVLLLAGWYDLTGAQAAQTLRHALDVPTTTRGGSTAARPA
jgi:RNA polymerase sigma-70 factor (ECF subfamily)